MGINNQPFSISLWIEPQSRSGSLVHLSTSSTGVGSWCTSLLGFASNGTLVGQIYNGTMVSIQASALLPLVSSRTSATSFLASGTTPNYVTLANALSGLGTCLAGTIALGPFQSAIDNFAIYYRELTTADVCALYFS